MLRTQRQCTLQQQRGVDLPAAPPATLNSPYQAAVLQTRARANGYLSWILMTPKWSMLATSPVSNQLSASTQGLSALW